MAARGRRLLPLALGLASALPLAAQQPTPARDSATVAADTGYAVIFSEDIMSNAPQYVTLSSHTAYRIDIIPGGILTIQLRGLGAVPLSLHPMENPAGVEGGQSFLITPTVSGEYRLILSFTGTRTHIRIVRDPAELALLQGRAKPSLGMLTLSLRGVYLTGATTINTFYPATDVYTSGSVLAWEACLGLERGRFTGMPRLGGCMLTFGTYSQSNGAILQIIGTNPDYELSRPLPAVTVSAGPVIAFGRATVGGRSDVSYWIVGGGVDVGWNVFGLQRLQLVLSPGLALVHQGGYNIQGPPAHDSPAHDVLGLRMAAGLQVHI